MNIFTWDTTFETGLKDVDDQHKNLVELTNNLANELAHNDVSLTQVESIIRQLADYAKQHFRDEEELMVKLNIHHSHLENHIHEHQSFLNDIESMLKEIDVSKLKSDKTLLDFLIHWLVYHLLGSDQSMARQLIKIKQGTTPEEVFLQEEHKALESTEPLLNALNVLFQQVSKRNRELSQINAVLEQKVEERTQDLMKANKELEVLALTDSLTNLPNRRYAMKMLKELWQESNENNFPLSCMMIDADNFKHINDSYGHDAGDVVLKTLANELSHSVRTDDIVCRLGGDEFFIICPQTPLEGALHVAKSMRKKIADLKVDVAGGSWLGSISVGVASKTIQMSNFDNLLKNADESVYLAKDDGRNCVRAKQKDD